MDRSTWCTKEDVLKDLELASGRRVTDVGDGFFVVGEQPPPSRVLNDEDDEIELRFGRAAPTQMLDQEGDAGPDLNGITKMLRMVQEYEKSSDEETRTSLATTTPNKKIIISKLNPNVKEFIPKNAQIASCKSTNDTSAQNTDVETNNKKDENEIIDSQILKDAGTDAVEITNKNKDMIKIGELTKETKKEMALRLKNQISAKENITFEEKRQTNLAIVNLLKLYAKPEPKATEQPKPLKLLTPHFFENCKASDFYSNTEDTSKNTDGSFGRITSAHKTDEAKIFDDLDQPREAIVDKKIDNLDDAFAKNNSRSKKLKEHNDVNVPNDENNETDHMNETTLLTPDMANTGIIADQNIPSVVVDPYIAESINKVNNWLEDKPYVTVSEKEKPKSPALFLGAIAYKRKDPVTCKSPSEVAEKKISRPAESSYKPSSYAEELLKKYKEKNKTITPTLNIWEKLEEDLKKKDKEIIKQKKKV